MKNKTLSLVIISAIMASFVLPFMVFGSNGGALSFRAGTIYPVTTTIAPTVIKVPSTAIQNGKVVTLGATPSSNCTSTPALLYQNFTDAVAATAITNCEIGIGLSNTTGMVPYYMLNPAFGGLSMYGLTTWNSTASGYATFRNTTIITNCGASGTPAACNSTKKYFYSYTSSVWERQAGITTGTMGLPEGVLPRPAHDILLPGSINSTPVVSYLVRVWVFDPNIFPNATTGRCKQVIASNLSNSTGNCLNNTAALARAIKTTSTAVVAANKNNILFTSKNIPPSGGIPPLQAVIIYDVPTVSGKNTTVTMYSTNNTALSNSNLKKLLYVAPSAPATTTVATTVASTTIAAATTIAPSSTIASQYGSVGSSSTLLYAVVIIVVIVIVIAAWYMMSKKKK
jgi:hypothetical protein